MIKHDKTICEILQNFGELGGSFAGARSSLAIQYVV